jgi:hypothetical protein
MYQLDTQPYSFNISCVDQLTRHRKEDAQISLPYKDKTASLKVELMLALEPG